jgi:hypothetical protein
MEKKNLFPHEMEPRFLGHAAPSPLLLRLSQNDTKHTKQNLWTTWKRFKDWYVELPLYFEGLTIVSVL